MKKIHFMGIGGSACAGVALLAKNAGFEVSGCDLAANTPYLPKVKEEGIQVFEGHDKSHLVGVDLVSISPAIEYQSKENSEYIDAKKEGKLEHWDKFVGDYLLKNKESICFAGTHGKSTTASLAGLVFEKGGLDPSALIGAKVKEWGGTFRVGNSNYFIIESDEFSEKFLNYKPSTIVLNNIEFDHPDYFDSFESMIVAYEKFIRLLTDSKNLIVNQDSPGISKLFNKLGKEFLDKINVYGYTISDKPLFETKHGVKGEVLSKNENTTEFKVQVKDHDYVHSYALSIPGIHNVQNALGVIILSKLYDIDDAALKTTLQEFKGIGRRLDLIGEKNGIKVYDDYAHHPTEIKANLAAIRQKYPENRIFAINEPHSYSRTKALLNEYEDVFNEADRVIIAPIFKARDMANFGISEKDILKVSKHKNIIYEGGFEKITKLLQKEARKGDVILVMGAGNSYQLARDILESI